MKNDPEEQRRAEAERHVELDHRTGPDRHETMERGEAAEDADDRMTARDIPQQDGAGDPPYRPPAEGDDRRGAPPDRA